jgi:hypothetical protein
MNYDIREYGALADGRTVNTKAIQAAVDACAEAGGGRVVVPAGTFVSGPIFLKSNVEFHLSAGALLKANPDMSAYSKVDLRTHGHRINTYLSSLITAVQCENVSVTGRGMLDGNGKVWWDEIDAGRPGPRPVLVYFLDCDRVQLEGVRLRNSAAWTVLPLLCRDVEIRGIELRNPWKPYHNCDGIDVHSCRNVRIFDCLLDTGDDGICLKSIPDWFISAGGDNAAEAGAMDKVDYSLPRVPCENVTIENCTVLRAHSGVAIWAEVIGGLRNVTVTNCVFENTRTGIQFARYPWPGGYVRDVTISNIVMRRVEIGIQLSNLRASWQTMNEGPEMETTPKFHNIRISNVTGTQINAACIMNGMETNPVHDIEFSHIRMEANLGFQMSHAKNIRFDAINLESQSVPLVMKDCENVELFAFNAKPSTPEISVIEVEGVKDVWIHGSTAAPGTGVFLSEIGDGNDVLLEGNRMKYAEKERATLAPDNAWNICSHAFNGSRWIRDSGKKNTWLPLPAPVAALVRDRWTPEQLDGIWSVSRVEANARDGAEVTPPDVSSPGYGAPLPGTSTPEDRRRIYIIESRHVDERLVVFEDGELLRTVTDPDFHAHFEERQKDFVLAEIDKANGNNA